MKATNRLFSLAVFTMTTFAATGCGASTGESRSYDLSWTVSVADIPEGSKEAVLWIALPLSLPEQRVGDVTVETPHPWERVSDADFGNDVVRVTIPNPASHVSVDLHAHVTRLPVSGGRDASLSDAERRLFLREEALVSLSPRIRAIADSVGGDARDRYEYVLRTMDYDKSTPGWGQGDSERACDVGKGNCTDFHSLFMSLSRAEAIPAVFEMGYSTLPEGEANHEGGYHCWAWFHEDGRWVPVDISEADKHPEKASFFFGNLDADRITFSRGRDVVLPGMKGLPLNYLPSGGYGEVDGLPWAVTRTISYTVGGV